MWLASPIAILDIRAASSTVELAADQRGVIDTSCVAMIDGASPVERLVATLGREHLSIADWAGRTALRVATNEIIEPDRLCVLGHDSPTAASFHDLLSIAVAERIQRANPSDVIVNEHKFLMHAFLVNDGYAPAIQRLLKLPVLISVPLPTFAQWLRDDVDGDTTLNGCAEPGLDLGQTILGEERRVDDNPLRRMGEIRGEHREEVLLRYHDPITARFEFIPLVHALSLRGSGREVWVSYFESINYRVSINKERDQLTAEERSLSLLCDVVKVANNDESSPRAGERDVQ
jgi:hypothetical protein